MPAEMGPVISAVDEYGDQRYAEGAASRQAEVDALVTQRNDLLTKVVDAEGQRDDVQAAYDAHMAGTHPVTPPPEPDPEPPTPTRQVILGMSAFPNVWDERLAQVGANGINARRIFADLSKGPRDKENLIRKAIADGMIPVLSYKGTPTPANTAALRAFLTSLDTLVTATYWHEPHGDMTPAEFRTRSRVFLDGVQAPNVEVGPILNGWLLDNRVADWTSYTDAALMRDWDFIGVDTYSEGTVAAPSSTLLTGRAIPKMLPWLTAQGHPDKKILVGEFNGQTEAAIKYAGEQILSVPNVWIACLWNVDHPISDTNPALKFNALAGARLAAFRATKADPRVLQ